MRNRARLRVLALGHPLDALVAARGTLFVWAPVCMAGGIGGYFALPQEPGAGLWTLCGLGLALALAWAWRAGPRWRPLALALALVLGGGLLAAVRSHWVAAPVLGHRYYGPVTGRVVALDRSLSDFPRVTLDRVALSGIAPAALPARVRITLRSRLPGIEAEPGQVVMITAHLSPPPGPAEPGGFDFRRMAWFDRLGATGYATSPLMLWQPARGAWLGRLRMDLARAIRARIPGQPGAFAAAVATGERGGIERATADDLRASNLAHLLAISGLHMGLLTGFVFAALRLGLALIPPLALRLPAKKIAAIGALAAAIAYLALSGGNIATQRAFVMVAVMLGAVLADRRALTLRSVALAALIILVLQPESLTGPGFQMSFAATTALVAAFGVLRGRAWGAAPGPLRAAAALMFSSFVAGLATAPIAAASFNRLAEYGLLANVLSVPVMGMVVMPAAVIAALLAPLGLAGLPLWAMGLGAQWILAVAHRVAGLHGAVVPVVTPPGWVLPTLALGALLLMLWRGPPRWGGALVMVAALAGWTQAERPALLISADGRLVGLMTPAGRVLSSATAAGFAARSWLENDGDAASRAIAAARPGFAGPRIARSFRLGRWSGAVLGRNIALDALNAACRQDVILITSAAAPGLRGPCRIFAARSLARDGAVAIDFDGARLIVRHADQVAGQRPWVHPARPAYRRRQTGGRVRPRSP